MIKFSRQTLKNGLKVLVHTDKSTPLVTFNILYKVGARNEDPERTGFAHLFEHLMFGGTKEVPDFDTPLQNVGAENNAFTTNDYTDYYITLPANNIETAFWIEADRMNGLAFTQESLDVQRNVVIEEFKERCLNKPYGDVEHLVRSLAYKVHPYQWPTIGKATEHIANATIDEVKDFFYRHYAPDNAIIVVAGNIDTDKAFKYAEKWFEHIDRKAHVAPIAIEPQQNEHRTLSVDRNAPARQINISYHTGGRFDRDYYVTDIITDLLANGSSARLTQNLIRRDRLMTRANAHILGSIDPGLMCLSGTLLSNISFEKAETALRQELTEIANGNFSDYEIQKIKNKNEANKVYEEMDNLNKAINLATYEMVGDANLINTERYIYDSVEREEICNTLNRICIKENESILYYK